MPAPAITAIIGLTPYLIETTTLLVNFIETLTADDLDENDAAKLEAAIQKYNDSAAGADQALAALRQAIEERRNQNTTQSE